MNYSFNATATHFFNSQSAHGATVTMTQSHLIDVRTPAEFATGALPGAVNIEYQLIDQLHESHYAKADEITLYCRSGRRSAIALRTLHELGYQNVRDIGGLEEARDVLKREEAARKVKVAEAAGTEGLETASAHEAEGARVARERALNALLEGLKDASASEDARLDTPSVAVQG